MSPTSQALSHHPIVNAVAADAAVTPQKILETGFGFFPSKVLLTAVELDVFTTLGARSMNAKELRNITHVPFGLEPLPVFLHGLKFPQPSLLRNLILTP